MVSSINSNLATTCHDKLPLTIKLLPPCLTVLSCNSNKKLLPLLPTSLFFIQFSLQAISNNSKNVITRKLFDISDKKL